MQPAELISLLRVENVIIMHTLASSTFIFWDQCLTFREEVELIWCAKWSLVSLLFFVVRYLTFAIRVLELVFYTNVSRILRPSVGGCKIWIWSEAISGHALTMAVEVLLIMRTFAFYGRKKSFLVAIFFIFAIEHTASLFILANTLPKFGVWPSSNLSSNLHSGACVVDKINSMFPSYWIPCLIFQFILFILLITKFFHTKWNTGMSAPHLLTVFVRDGAWAFALIFAVLLWSAAGFAVSPEKGDVALTWCYSILGFAGSRLILNLRAAAHERSLCLENAVFEAGILTSLSLPADRAQTSRLDFRLPTLPNTETSRSGFAVNHEQNDTVDQLRVEVVT